MGVDAPIIMLMGPTASGKTDLAVELVKKFPVEIISVDSAMVYKGMNIGTAKPSSEVLEIAPHRLIDIRDPADTYSVAQFRQDALAEIKDIVEHRHIPLLVGGTMMYHRALLYGLSDLPEADQGVRKELELLQENIGLEGMHAKLKSVDKVSAKRLHPNDTQRVHRALEVYQITGKPLSTFFSEQQKIQLPAKLVRLIVAPENREVLRQRIALRFHTMLQNGFIEEVAILRDRKDLSKDHAAMKSVGYRQVWEYLDGHSRYDEMLEKGINATRQFAKRQFTWLRKEMGAIWFDSENTRMQGELGQYLQTRLDNWK